MTRTTLTVFAKEVIDNLRDRRTLTSALVMGPILGPVLFAFVISLSIERSLENVERTMELPVIGQEHAGNLLRYLESRNIDIVDGPDDRTSAIAAVKTGEHDVVLIIPEEFGTQLADTIPARIELVSDQANTDADRDARRVRRALYAYNQELAGIRLTARGVNPMVLRPFNIDEVDVSTPSGRSVMLLGIEPHQFGFLASTVLTPDWRSLSMNGPVPLALRLAWLPSSPPFTLVAVVVLCSAAHSRSMM